jgi:hypothetical protein
MKKLQHVVAQIPQGGRRHLTAGDRKAIRAAVADGRLKGSESIQAQMVLTIRNVGINQKVER